MSEDTMVLVGDEEVGLMDIAGLEMDDVQEYRLQVTPAGKYHWRIVESKLDHLNVRRDKDGDPQDKVEKPVIQFELEAQNCFALVDDKLDPSNFVGQKHTETFFITDPQKDLGRVKAFLVDIGLEGKGTLQSLLDTAHGMEFVSDVTNRPDKNNPDFIYANLKKPMSVEAFQETQSEEEAA